MKKNIKGSEALLLALMNEGVETLFAYPGGSIIPVFDSLYDHCDDFKQILVRHEQGAAHAAQGYARVSGKTGVCLVTSGPGATNTVTGVSDAMLDSTPIVVIAGQVAASTLGTDAFQEIDLVGVTQPITKWSFQIQKAEDIAWAVARAFYIARSGRPGPVVLDFTKSAQVSMVEYEPVSIDYIRSYIPIPEIDPEMIEKAVELIDSSRRPMALIGQGVELGEAQNEIIAFIEKGDIPAARTMLGMSALLSDHPLNMGMLGMHGNIAPNMQTNRCDLIIAVGMRFDDRVTGNLQKYARQAKVIHLDIDKSEFNKNVKCDVPVLGDCKHTLAMITARMAKNSHKEWIEEFTPYMRLENEKIIEKAIHPQSGPLKMGEVINLVSELVDDSAVMVTDVGLNQLFATRYFKYRHKRSIITSGGLGTMGFGMPAAIGATCGAPDRTVVLFVGDGGMQMNIQELGTIMQSGAPVKIVLLNNSYLGNVRQWQELFFNKRYSCTPMVNPDYMKIAQAYGIKSANVSDRDSLKEAITAMFTHNGPYLLEVIVEKEENIWPMIPVGAAVDEINLGPDN